MDSFRSDIRKPQFRLAELAALVLGVGLALRWPVLAWPVFAASWTLLCVRVGLSLVWTLLLTSLVGFALGLALPTVRGH